MNRWERITFWIAGVTLLVVLFFAGGLIGCASTKEQSWDQENLHNQARLMVCEDRSYVYGTQNGELRLCQ